MAINKALPLLRLFTPLRFSADDYFAMRRCLLSCHYFQLRCWQAGVYAIDAAATQRRRALMSHSVENIDATRC